MNNEQIIEYIKDGLKQESKINEGRVLGRSWSASPPLVGTTQSLVSGYNYNNIMMHLKDYDLTKGDFDEETDFSGTFNFSRVIEKKLIVDLAQYMRVNFQPLSGYFTSGGTEANMYSLWVARNWSRSIEGAEKTTWIFPDTAHYSIKKAADILGLTDSVRDEVHTVSCNTNLLPSADVITNLIKEKRLLSDDPIILVQTVISTEIGLIDPVRDVVEFIRDNSYENIFIHVDACFSGIVLPALDGYEEIFSYKEINTIAVDLHKTFGAPVGSGVILINRGYQRFSRIKAPYLLEDDLTLLGSRSGSNAIVSWALFQSEVKTGNWSLRLQRSMDSTRYFYEMLDKFPFINIPYKPFVNYFVFKFLNIDNEKIRKMEEALNRYSISATEYRGEKLYKVIVTDNVKNEVLEELVSNLYRIENKK